LDNGKINLRKLLLDMDENVKLVSFSHVNNTSGLINDVESISSKIKNLFPQLKIHVDASQSFGKIALSLKSSVIDSLTISSQKMGGPKGIAGFYLKKNFKIFPLLIGGGQENGIRSSTINTPLILSWVESVKETFLEINKSSEHVKTLNLELREQLESNFPNIIFPNDSEECSPYILMFVFQGISSDIIVRHLEKKNIIISSSAACSSKIKGENPTFSALKLPLTYHKNILRLSFSPRNTSQEVKYFIEQLKLIYFDIKLLI